MRVRVWEEDEPATRHYIASQIDAGPIVIRRPAGVVGASEPQALVAAVVDVGVGDVGWGFAVVGGVVAVGGRGDGFGGDEGRRRKEDRVG